MALETQSKSKPHAGQASGPNEKPPTVVGSTDMLDALGKLARRWRRSCGRPGGADTLTGHGNYMADCARRECAKELEKLMASNTTVSQTAQT